MTRKLARTVMLSLALIVVIASAQAQTTSLPPSVELIMNLGDELASQSFNITANDGQLTNITFTPTTLTLAGDNQAIPITIEPAQITQLAAGETQTVQVLVETAPSIAGTYNGLITVRYGELGNDNPPTIPVTLTVAPRSGVGELPFELNVTGVPGNKSVPISHTVISTDASIKLPFFLAQSETAINQLDAVLLSAFVSGSTGEPVSTAAISFKSNNSDVSTTGVTVPPNGKRVLVELTIRDLPQTGTFSLYLIAEHQGRFVETHVATITRSAELTVPKDDLVLMAGSNPGGDTISDLEVQDTATTAIVPFFLRQPADATEPLVNVQLQAYLTNQTGAVEGGASLTFNSSGTQVSATGVTVPSRGREVPLALTIGNLPSAGAYTVHLFAEQQGRAVRLSEFSLTRLEIPALTVVGSENGALTLNRTITAFEHVFRIASGNGTAVSDLQIIVDNLVGPDGNPATTSTTPTNLVSLTLSGRGVIAFTVAADLPQAGEYKGSITLIYANKREVTNLTVNRTRPATMIEVLDLGTIQGQTLLGMAGKTEIAIALHNKGSQTVEIEQITPIRLERLEGDGGKINVLADLQFSLNTEGGKPQSANLTLTDGESLRLVYTIKGLTRVGTYQGDLILDVTDATPPAAKSFTLKLKAPGWWAALVIGLSILTSSGFRHWQGNALPRRLRQRRILELRADLEHLEKRFTDLESKEIALLEKFRVRLSELYEDADLGADNNADTKLSEIEKKLSLVPKIVETRRRIRALHPAEAFAALAQQWTTIIDHFIAHIDEDGNEKTQALTKLLDEDIDNAIKGHILTIINELRVKVTNQETFFPETKVQLTTSVIDQYITTSETAANAEKIQEAQIALENARKSYVILLAQDLNRYLPIVPAGYRDKDEWNPTRQEIENKLQLALRPDLASSADDLLKAYQEGYRLYLSKVISALATEIQNRLDSLNQAKTLTDERKNEYGEKLNGYLIILAAAQVDIAHNNLDLAGKAYLRVRDDFQVSLPPDIAKQLGIRLGGTPDIETAKVDDKLQSEGTLPPGIEVGDVETESELPRRRAKDIRHLEREIKIMEIIAIVVALILAILGGLYLLWEPNATWGSLGDIVVAVFWGLGLHQVSNAGISALGTFPGLPSLVKQFGDPGSR